MTTGPSRPRPIPDGLVTREKFMARVDMGDGSGCWNWIGTLSPKGYGSIRLGCRDWRAHRLSLWLAGVDITPEHLVDHLCRNRRCVRPDHLEATDMRMNTARSHGPTGAITRARLSGECINGHVIEEVGVYIRRDAPTSPRCRECMRQAGLRATARKRQVRAAQSARAVEDAA